MGEERGEVKLPCRYTEGREAGGNLVVFDPETHPIELSVFLIIVHLPEQLEASVSKNFKMLIQSIK